MKKRIMCLMLTLCMVFAMLPAAAAKEKNAYTVASETVFNNIKKLPIDNYTTVEDMENALMALLPKDNNYRIVIEFNTHVNATTTKTGQIDCTPYLYDPDRDEWHKLSSVLLTIPIAKEDPQEKINIEADVAAIGKAFGEYCSAVEIDLESFRSSVEKSALLEAAQSVKNKFTKVSWKEFSVSSPKDGKDGYMKGTLKVVLGAETRTVEFKADVHPNGTVTMTSPAVAPTTPATPAAETAYPSTQAVTIDGKKVEFQMYALKDAGGNPTNYVKVRDLALALNGTKAQFSVGWDGAVNLESGKAYTSNGSENKTPFSGERSYTLPANPTNVNGAASDLTAIVLTDDAGGGYTYYKLRDLGCKLGFNVDWSADKGIFIETDKPYSGN